MGFELGVEKKEKIMDLKVYEKAPYSAVIGRVNKLLIIRKNREAKGNSPFVHVHPWSLQWGCRKKAKDKENEKMDIEK